MAQLSDIIFDKSDNGREIILSYYPQARDAFSDKRKAFKIRPDEKTASARVKQNKDGIWIVTDFGDEMKGRNGIEVVMKEENVDFTEALSILATRYHISTEAPKAVVNFKTPSPKEAPGYYFEYKEAFTDEELNILGPKVTQIICDRYNLKSCKSFTHVTDDGKKIITESTSDYPIFVYDHTTWQKIYQPLHKDKAYRFRHAGNKPIVYVNGLDVTERHFKQFVQDVKDSWDFEEKPDGPKEKDLKLSNIIIASGDRDALNLVSFEYNVIWMNSETDKLSFETYRRLNELSNNIYVLPDIDLTGKKQGVDLALQYSKIQIIWLPKWLSMRKDFRGNPRKDFRDFVQVSFYPGNEKVFINLLSQMVENAMPMRFWDETRKLIRATKEWVSKYEFNNDFAMHFIEHSGFFLFKDEQQKDDFSFIKIEGNVVEIVKGFEIKKFMLDFLRKKNAKIDLRNMLHKTPQLSDKNLAVLNEFKPKFTKGYAGSQYMFFKNCIWHISTLGVKKHSLGSVKNYVWKDDIINFEPKIEADYFEIFKNENGDFDINIKNSEVKYLNYLTNTSRVHWKDELQKPFKGKKSQKEKQAYFLENKFNIAGSYLTEDQIQEQKLHLINKIFTIGYLLHSYKDETKSWFVYNMDYTIVDDTESNGGTGKSLFFKMLAPILKNIKKIDGRERNAAEKDFLFDGVTDKTDLILVEDMDAYFRLHRFLTPITDDLAVNPKGQKPYSIKFKDSPKIGGTSNFGVGNVDGTLSRRVLYVATGDYYHEIGDKYEETRQVSDDFEGKRLITDFTDTDWQQYFNFCAQCVKFYLSQSKRINPPMENVEKRNLVRDMKGPFKNWADAYFDPEGINVNTEIDKKLAMENFMKSENQTKYTATRFKKSVIDFCKYYGYEFNPKDLGSVKDGRIISNVGGETREFFYIKTNKAEPTNRNTHYEPQETDEPQEDLPF